VFNIVMHYPAKRWWLWWWRRERARMWGVEGEKENLHKCCLKDKYFDYVSEMIRVW